MPTPEYTLRAQAAYERRNIESKRFYCTDCDHPFSSSYDLRRHLTSTKHVPREREPVTYRCDICNYITHRHSNIVKHYDSRRHMAKLPQHSIEPTTAPEIVLSS